MTPDQHRTIAHAIAACRVAEGVLTRIESEVRSVRSRLETRQADLARLLHEDAGEVTSA